MLNKTTLIITAITFNISLSKPPKGIIRIVSSVIKPHLNLQQQLTFQARICNNSTPPCSIGMPCICNQLRKKMQPYEIAAAMKKVTSDE